MNSPSPAHKLASLLHKHRTAITAGLCDAQQIADEALQAHAAQNDEVLNEAASRLAKTVNILRSRLVQVRAVKDTASAVGVKPNELKEAA